MGRYGSSQYASKDYRRLLKAHGFVGSMSRKGDCWDNCGCGKLLRELEARTSPLAGITRLDSKRKQDVLNYISMF